MKKVLRFTASWCGPCKMLAKTLEEVETNVPIEVIDIDVNPEIATEFGIRSVPNSVAISGLTSISIQKLQQNLAFVVYQHW